MNGNNHDLGKRLARLCERGITEDREVLLEDIVSQFTDPKMFIREYVVNAMDAGATACVVTGSETPTTVSVIVEDDGHGVDRESATAMLTAFQSVKRGGRLETVGEKGIGLLSVARMPGQIGWGMRSSTGEESWRIRAGYLLANQDIALERIEPIAPQSGTRFTITFRKGKEVGGLTRELEKYVEILAGCLAFQSRIKLLVVVPSETGGDPRIIQIYADWATAFLRHPRRYVFEIGGYEFEEIIGLGPRPHEVFNKRVLVTDKVSLTGFDLAPGEQELGRHLCVRVDSPQFKLTLGRDRIIDEHILKALAKKNREVYLVEYLDELKGLALSGRLAEAGVNAREFEELLVSVLSHPRVGESAKGRFGSVPVVDALNRRPSRLTLDEVAAEIQGHGLLYVADDRNHNVGADFAAFRAPVISSRQVVGLVEMLRERWGDRVINLCAADLVMELPPGMQKELGERELNFQKHLAFDPHAIEYCRMQMETKARAQEPVVDESPADLDRLRPYLGDDSATTGLEVEDRETDQARVMLSQINWRVTWLVNSDLGPNHTQLFLVRDQGREVLLNLYHPDIKQLMALSESDPILSGHWALALALTSPNKIMPHLGPDVIEKLIVSDGMAKLGAAAGVARPNLGDFGDAAERRLLELMRDAADDEKFI